MKFYHGTTAVAAERILTDGFGSGGKSVWICSDTDVTYFWEDTLDGIDGEGLRRAFESALIASAISGSVETRTVVFQLDIPDEFVNDWVLPDCSCENMDVPPTISAAKAAQIIKTNTSRILMQEFEPLSRMGVVWTRSYFASTAGDVSARTIQKYIENQKKRG